jgi:hypothetical protein
MDKKADDEDCLERSLPIYLPGSDVKRKEYLFVFYGIEKKITYLKREKTKVVMSPHVQHTQG